MIPFMQSCGLAGLIILSVTIILAGVMLRMAFTAVQGRQPMALYAMLALLPLLIGMMGTARGYVGLVGQEIVAEDLAAARRPAYLGGGCTAGLLLLCAGIGMVNTAARRDLPED